MKRDSLSFPSAEVSLRFDFYRQSYVRHVYTLGCAFLVFFFLLFSIIIVWQVGEDGRKLYFPVSEKGTILPVTSLDDQFLPDSEVQAWVAEAVPYIYSFDSQSFRSQLNVSGQNYFLPSAFTSFKSALVKAKVIEFMKSKNLLVVKTTIESAPTLERKDVVDGVFTWEFSIPITVRYFSDRTDIKRGKAFVTVKRVKQTVRAIGIGVSSFVIQ